jgi:hypothetical protein
MAAPATGHLLRDDLVDSIGWDARFLRTLRDLLLHPARIVAAQMAGSRGRYLPPVKLFFALAALYMFGLSLVQPFNFDRIFGETAKSPAGIRLVEKIHGRGLTMDQVNERFQSRMNTVAPIAIAVALLPLVLILRGIDRRRPWHQHLMFLVAASNVCWVVGLLVLPVALLGDKAHAAVLLVAMYAVFGYLFWKFYPGRSRTRTAVRTGLFLIADFVVGSLIQVPLTYAALASAVLF